MFLKMNSSIEGLLRSIQELENKYNLKKLELGEKRVAIIKHKEEIFNLNNEFIKTEKYLDNPKNKLNLIKDLEKDKISNIFKQESVFNKNYKKKIKELSKNNKKIEYSLEIKFYLDQLKDKNLNSDR